MWFSLYFFYKKRRKCVFRLFFTKSVENLIFPFATALGLSKFPRAQPLLGNCRYLERDPAARARGGETGAARPGEGPKWAKWAKMDPKMAQ